MHLAYTFRRIARSPMDAAVAVVSLGVGIGAVAAMLGIADTLFLRPPPGVREPTRVVGIGPWARFQQATYPDYLDLQRDATSFEAIGAFATWDYSARIGTEVEPARGMLATSTLLPLLGIEPVSGRSFLPSEDRPGAEPVVLVSRTFWRRTVGSDESPLGATIRLADRPFRVIGVVRENVTAPDLSQIDIVLPITNAPWLGGVQALQSRAYRWVRIVARLRANITTGGASAEATAIYRRANRGDPNIDETTLLHTVIPVRRIVLARHEPNTPVIRVLLWTTILATALLIIACANVASILLARGLRERHAVAIRVALGASPRTLLTQVLLEVLTLVVFSLVLSLVFAQVADVWVTSRFLGATVPPPALDARTFAAVLAVAFPATVLCAITPVIEVLRTEPRAVLSAAGLAMTSSHRSFFRVILVAQIGLGFVLVAAAILFGVSLRNATRADIGIKLDHLLIADIDLHAAGLTSTDAVAAVRRTVERVTSIPAVVTAGMTNAAAVPGLLTMELTVPGGRSVNEGPTVEGLNGVTSGYIDALGMHITMGRSLTEMDVQSGRPVMIVSEGFVRHFWPHESPLGQCVQVGGPTAPCSQVVGVVSDRSGGPGDPRPDLEVYVPLESSLIPKPVADIYAGREVAVRFTGDPGGAAVAVRAALLDVVPQLTSVRVRTGEEYLERQYRSWRFGTGVLGTFGLLALVLAGFGVFGACSCSVAQRARELGIRCVLGATRKGLAALVLSEAALVGVIGVSVGLVIAITIAHVIRALAFGVSPMDARIYGVVAAVLVVTALVASILPALRAAGTEPMNVLRSE